MPMKLRHPCNTCPALVTLLGLVFLLGGCGTTNHHVADCTGTEQRTSRLFLQQVTADSALIKWRGNAQVVCAGSDIKQLDIFMRASAINGHKVARLSGLQPDTVYYYSIGAAATGIQTQQFRTAPVTGKLPSDGNTHIWLLGDSGTATQKSRARYTHKGEALAVKEGFLTYNREQANNEPLDLLLLLGDNAYSAGTDNEWQEAFFELYPKIISRTATWPTIGNHEMGMASIDVCLLAQLHGCDDGPVIVPMGGISESSDPASYDSDGKGPDDSGLPYLEIFSLPANGEAGGVASGTEQYYAFDYGNVHVVSLDSQLSNRDAAPRAAWREGVVAYLSNNTLDWTIVIFHHPHYTTG
jgi:hypothetical protein